MIDVDWRVQETDGVALVAAVVENAAPTPRRIELAPRIDGAVLPPRRRGLPEPGWSDERFTGVVPAEGRTALGFATRGDIEDPPVAVVDEGRARRDGTRVRRDGALARRDGASQEAADDPVPTAVLRDLGSPVPPRDAVPDGATGSDSSLAEQSGSSTGQRSPSLRVRRCEVPSDQGTSTEPLDTSNLDQAEESGIPGPVADWLDRVATRIDRAERHADRPDLDGAAAAVETDGGLAGVEELVDALGADETALRVVADRATELADACDVREDVPVDAYRRLA